MKVLALAITLLAACLIQGNNAQVGGLRDPVRNGAIGSVNAAAGDHSKLSAGAQSQIDSAVSGLSVDAITDAANNLHDELLEIIRGAQAEVIGIVRGVRSSLSNITSNVEESALAIVEKALEGTTVSVDNVKAILEKAVKAGIDISDCVAKTTDELGNNGVSSAVQCVVAVRREVTDLSKNVTNVAVDAATFVNEAVIDLRTCSTEVWFEMLFCDTQAGVSFLVKILSLEREAMMYEREAAALAATLPNCIALAAAGNAKLNVRAALRITSCVLGKIAN